MSDFFIDIFGCELIVDSILRILVRMMLATIALRYSWKKSNMHEIIPFFLQLFILTFLLL